MEENDSLASDPLSPGPNGTPSETLSPTPSEPSKNESAKTATPSGSFLGFLRELVLATIQHANRSIAILLIAIMVGIGVFLYRKELACWLSNAESVRAWSFEVRLRQGVSSNRLDAEFSKLVDLNDQQLQLFLVLGKERGSNAAGQYGIAYKGEEVTWINLLKLQEIGLLTNVKKTGSENNTGADTYTWDVTPKGLKLHHLLMDHIVTSIKEAAACQCGAADCKCE